ncbi:MAG TPA: YtxH domain-containing protein [Gemmatimonadaceae bacterium]|nr:YtxH domain-containing protein [Gemmatimonadaceae bacterium]
MAYAEPNTRIRTGNRAGRPEAGRVVSGGSKTRRTTVEPSALTEAGGVPYEHSDLRRAGLLGGALALGLLLGAGAALLFAPQAGEETRADLLDGGRRLRSHAGEAWDDLRDELRWAARRGGKRVRRGFTRGGWAAGDALDRGRRRLSL